MRNFKAVIFDMDGLLLDSERLALEAFQSTCSQFHLDDLSDVFKKCIGTNSQLCSAILKEGLKGLVDYQEFSSAWKGLFSEITTAKPVPLKEGVNYLLEHIRSIDIPMAVATSTKTELAKSNLSDSGLIEFFDIVIGGDQVTDSKPSPEIYIKAASALFVNPTECLALEDSSNGVKSAVAAGMTVVQIPDLVEPDEELLKMGHIVLDSLLDVPSYEYS